LCEAITVISDLQIVFMLSSTVIMVSQRCIGYVAVVYQSGQGNCLVLPTTFFTLSILHCC
jgi:hypothetical protein